MTKKITLEDLAVMMKEGFDEIHAKFATKEDLKKFATKEDLKKFATKEDLLSLEKRQGEKFATKNDLKGLESRIENKFATKEDLNKGIDEILTKEDEVISLLNRNNAELAASAAARVRQEDKIENHEIRITELEKIS